MLFQSCALHLLVFWHFLARESACHTKLLFTSHEEARKNHICGSCSISPLRWHRYTQSHRESIIHHPGQFALLPATLVTSTTFNQHRPPSPSTPHQPTKSAPNANWHSTRLASKRETKPHTSVTAVQAASASTIMMEYCCIPEM